MSGKKVDFETALLAAVAEAGMTGQKAPCIICPSEDRDKLETAVKNGVAKSIVARAYLKSHPEITVTDKTFADRITAHMNNPAQHPPKEK